jgi:hypothetical protein
VTSPMSGYAERRVRAPAGGARNLYGLVVHAEPTWREAVVGSAYLFGAFGIGFGVAAGVVGVVALRRRLSP